MGKRKTTENCGLFTYPMQVFLPLSLSLALSLSVFVYECKMTSLS